MGEKQDGAQPPPEGTNPGTAPERSQDTTTGNTNGGGNGASTAITLTPEQQSYVNQLIGAARTEGRTAGLTEAQRAEQQRQQAAEADRLKSEQKYQELSERQATELATLRQDQAAYQALLSTIQQELTADLAALDPSIRGLMPEGLTVAQQLSFVRKAQRTLAPKAGNETTTPGNADDPPPKRGSKERQTLEQKAVEEMRTSGLPL